MRGRYGCGASGVCEKRLDFLGMRAYNRRASKSLIGRCDGIGRRDGLKIHFAGSCSISGTHCAARPCENFICIVVFKSLRIVPPFSKR